MEPSSQILPVQKFFAVVGYIVFSFVIISGLCELISHVIYLVNPSFYTLNDQHNQEQHPTNLVFSQYTPRGVSEDERLPFSARVWIDLMSASPVYNTVEYAEEFWLEERERRATHRFHYRPFRLASPVEWHGNYTNVDNIVGMGDWRRTVNVLDTKNCDSQAIIRVWVLGGSTVWGVGSADAETIPSYLSKKLNTLNKDCFEIINLGQPSYVMNQELIVLIELLKKNNSPDVVIFYNGANDAYVGGFSPGIPTAHQDLVNIKLRLEGKPDFNQQPQMGTPTTFYFLQFARKTLTLLQDTPPIATVTNQGDIRSVRLTDDELKHRAKATIDNYLENIEIVEALAVSYNFEVYFFWQPILSYGDKPLNPFEQLMVDNPALLDIHGGFNETSIGELQTQALTTVYQEVEKQTSGEFYFLGRVFDQISEPLYIDWVHMGPRGNEIIAEAITQRVGETIE